MKDFVFKIFYEKQILKAKCYVGITMHNIHMVLKN